MDNAKSISLWPLDTANNGGGHREGLQHSHSHCNKVGVARICLGCSLAAGAFAIVGVHGVVSDRHGGVAGATEAITHCYAVVVIESEVVPVAETITHISIHVAKVMIPLAAEVAG